MSMLYCDICDLTIDTDVNTEHFEDDMSHQEMREWCERVGLKKGDE